MAKTSKENIGKIREFSEKVTAIDGDTLTLAGDDVENAKLAGDWILERLADRSLAGKQNKGIRRERPNIKPFAELSRSGKWKRLRKERMSNDVSEWN